MSATPDEAQIEQALRAKKLNAPRLTPAHIDAAIKAVSYTILPSGRTTVCELTLQNGYTVHGISSVVSKANFDHEIGKKVSYQAAREKIWQLDQL